jgi:hypothetical protein
MRGAFDLAVRFASTALSDEQVCLTTFAHLLELTNLFFFRGIAFARRRSVATRERQAAASKVQFCAFSSDDFNDNMSNDETKRIVASDGESSDVVCAAGARARAARALSPGRGSANVARETQ